MLRGSSFCVPFEDAGVFKYVREDNINLSKPEKDPRDILKAISARHLYPCMQLIALLLCAHRFYLEGPLLSEPSNPSPVMHFS